MKNLILLCLGLLLVASCKKEQPEMTKVNAGCDCAKEVSAGFKIGQYADIYKTQFIETDTIHMYMDYQDGNPANFKLNTNCTVDFVADLEGAISYQWQVGSNAISQTVRSFSLDFSDTIGTIPVCLIVKSKPNLICFPNDDGIDTVTKYLTIKHFKEFPLKGKYKGYLSNDPSTEFIIEIDTFKDNEIFMDGMVRYGIKNLPNGQGSFVPFNGFKTYSFQDIYESYVNEFNIDPYDGPGFGERAKLFDRSSKTITIPFSYIYRESITGPYHYFEKLYFIGKKL